MKKIKIKTIFGSHQIYQEIVNYPPEGVKYIGVSKATAKGEYYQNKKIKEFFGNILKKINLPRMIFVRSGNFDIVHSSRGIIPITNKPWVMDIEHVHSFFGLDSRLIKNKFWKKFIERRLEEKNCKAILCHCEATRQAFFEYLDCSKFKDKIKVLYPSSHLINVKKEKNDKIIVISMVSDFLAKAGPQILEAFSNIEKRNKNVELWFRGNVPEELKKKYNSENIQFINYFGNIIPRDKLLEDFYSKGNIFLYPTLADSFGYSLIDALVAGLPIIGSNLFAVPEVVENEKNGIIISLPEYSLKEGYYQYYPLEKMKKNEKKIINGIENALEKLIKNKNLRIKMGKESYKKISTGKFSIEKRNKQLKKIYEEALKD